MVGPPQPSLALSASRRCSSFRGSAMYFVPAMSSQIPRTSCRKRCTSAGGGGLLRLSIYATRIALFISWSILLLSAIKSLIPPEVPKAFSAAFRNSLSKGYSTMSVTACSICGYEVKCARLLSVALLVSGARQAIRCCKACFTASTRSDEAPLAPAHCQW